MSVIPSKIIPTLGSGSGGGGSGGGGSGASIDDIKAAVQSALGSYGPNHPVPDFTRAIPLCQLDTSSGVSTVFKLNVPGYLFINSNLNDHRNFYPYINYYFAAHPAYLLAGCQYDNAAYQNFTRPDFLERVLNYHGIDTNSYYINRKFAQYVIPGTSTYFTPEYTASDSGGIPSVFFVPAKSLSININPKDYVTPIFNAKHNISQHARNRIGNPGNIWVRQIFRGDWTKNFEISGNTWTLNNPGNIIHPKYKFAANGNGRFKNTTFFQTNGLLTGKNRIYFVDDSGSYVLRYFTAEEAKELYNSTNGQTYKNEDVTTGYGSRLNIDGSVQITPDHDMTYGEWLQLYAERWVVISVNYSGARTTASSGVVFNNTVFNRPGGYSSKIGITPNASGIAELSGADVVRKSLMTEFLEHDYGTESITNDLTDEIDNVPYFQESDFNQVVTPNWTSWGEDFTSSGFPYTVSRLRGLDDPPSGFGEADFEVMKSGNFRTLECDPDDKLPSGKTWNDSDMQTALKEQLERVVWFRGKGDFSAPQNASGLWSKSEEVTINMPPNCQTLPNVFSPTVIV